MASKQDRGLMLASKALEAAHQEKYEDAIRLFSEAAELISDDFRFFLNRSYCFFQLANYKMSLADAEAAIKMAEEIGIKSAKPYFRKAAALFAMKDFILAEPALEAVLLLDPECNSTKTMLNAIRNKHTENLPTLSSGDEVQFLTQDTLKVNGSMKPLRSPFVIKDKSTTVTIPRNPLSSVDVNGSANGSDSSNEVPIRKLALRRPTPSPELVAKMLGTNPVVEEGKLNASDLFSECKTTNIHGFHGLFVSNVNLNARKEQLESFFSHFGEVNGLFKIKNDTNDCIMIVIDYTNPEDPVKALTTLRDRIFSSGEMTQEVMKPLSLRFTASKSQKAQTYTLEDGLSKANEAEECFWFRGPLGCENRHDCPMKHVRQNYDVDSYAVFI